ncbi:serine/threonine protein kinase [Alcaligenes sp. DN25]|uniref:serine/threonine protein kinase n=1 Tax=Alcaligenes TaxID=507 RepID=UPI00202F9F22|nr:MULTISPECIES: serine/threonine protein kinase [Alcaligenes]URW82163.1 serine/threonine protein kinase [Alcaligenes sp. DN25]WEA66984.1 serine/threonine protein kinase [Alcaligenes faecalis]
MGYPTLEQYQEALQHPQTVFLDPELKSGRIRTSGLGLPVVVSGGFALTYAVEVGSSKNAVRCFHREAKGLEARYAAISKTLKALASPYFVDFEFQPQGVLLNGQSYPLVKMAWASGETLGEFIEANYANKSALTNLLNSLSQLSAYLVQQGIAHGDIQEGNLMVADDGRRIQLIDYDGMFVPGIAALGSSEIGHRDYQHPRRDANQFDGSLDRFSFIALNLALRGLCENPSLWSATNSGAGVILFRANDYADPGASTVFSMLEKISSLTRDSKNFAAVCRATYQQTPLLTDFLDAKNIPQEFTHPKSQPQSSVSYISQYPVLEATDYSAFAQHIGQMVELVGRIVDVKRAIGRHGRGKGKPYVFVNFAHWNGRCVKINIWSDALDKGGTVPTAAWVGKWVTIKGLVEPVYRNPKYKYEHIAISAAATSHIVRLTEADAQYRLKILKNNAGTFTNRSNSDLLRTIKGASSKKHTKPVLPPAPSLTPNQQILANMRQQSSGSTATGPSPSSHNRLSASPTQYKQGNSKNNSKWIIPWWIWFVGAFILFSVFN